MDRIFTVRTRFNLVIVDETGRLKRYRSNDIQYINAPTSWEAESKAEQNLSVIAQEKILCGSYYDAFIEIEQQSIIEGLF